MDCSLPGSSVHGISQARILEWVAIMGNLLLLIKKAIVPAGMREGPTSLCAALPNDFSSDDFRCKEQNTLALTIKILVVSNKNLPGGGLGSWQVYQDSCPTSPGIS
ncbi:unnamed protein product [Rangifer tarandus platyrhynchus]|uniref:Uncharacterized protein n=1 Tax=Rangifer tarandus platyrhynchus TaxID=3082113 RepID=A0ABN8ZM79_RANTA|nr:unnamed protein product [Rangifer tarandus platyrhynchus]